MTFSPLEAELVVDAELAIHVSSVTCCSPRAPASKSIAKATASASASTVPARATQRAAAGTRRPRTPAARGSQSR